MEFFTPQYAFLFIVPVLIQMQEPMSDFFSVIIKAIILETVLTGFLCKYIIISTLGHISHHLTNETARISKFWLLGCFLADSNPNFDSTDHVLCFNETSKNVSTPYIFLIIKTTLLFLESLCNKIENEGGTHA